MTTFAPELGGHPAGPERGAPLLPAVLGRVVAVHWEHVGLVVGCTPQHHLRTCLRTTCRGQIWRASSHSGTSE